VRVLAPGAVARMAWLDAPASLDNPAAAAMPVDVWVLSRAASAQAAASAPQPAAELPAGAPWLDAGIPALALRTGTAELWVRGECAAADGMFAREVTAALQGERRERIAPHAGSRVLPAAEGVRIARRGARLELSAPPEVVAPVTLAFAYPAAAAPLAVTGARARFYPGGEITGAPPVLVARIELAPGASAAISAAQPSAPLGYALQVLPPRVLSGQPAQVRTVAQSGVAGPQVAYRFDALHTAFGTGPAEHVYVALGSQRIHALALAADGRAQALTATVAIETARVSRCSAAGAPPGGYLLAWAGLWPAAALLYRRRCRKRAAQPRAGIDCKPLPVLKGL
jgi:hypothetical protein